MTKRIVYNGVEMIEGWPDRIQEAQGITEYSVAGRAYARIRYGDESSDWDAEHIPCHDCRVLKGQLHVPSCDVEECPACGEQAIGCDCAYDDENN